MRFVDPNLALDHHSRPVDLVSLDEFFYIAAQVPNGRAGPDLGYYSNFMVAFGGSFEDMVAAYAASPMFRVGKDGIKGNRAWFDHLDASRGSVLSKGSDPFYFPTEPVYDAFAPKVPFLINTAVFSDKHHLGTKIQEELKFLRDVCDNSGVPLVFVKTRCAETTQRHRMAVFDPLGVLPVVE